MELQGTVHKIGTVEEKGENKFKVCEVILDRKTSYQGKDYPNFTRVVFNGNRADLVAGSGIAVGDYIKVQGDIKGRFFDTADKKDLHAQDFEVWQIEILRKENPQQAAVPQQRSSTDGLV